MNPVRVRFRRLRAGAVLPCYATDGSAGMDLASASDEDIVLMPGARAVIPTGWAIELPPGYEGQVRARSGLASRYGIGVPNAPGTIDSDYRGEVGVLLINWGSEPFTIRLGERIAQLVVAPVSRVVSEEAEVLPESARGSGGFGSTGR